jgi:hypothetical protein
MDFFHGLDSNICGSFKANTMTGWVSKVNNTPEIVNARYMLACIWEKANATKPESRTALIFMTTSENTRSCSPKGRRGNYKVNARLVEIGIYLDPDMFQNKSSPTVSIQS